MSEKADLELQLEPSTHRATLKQKKDADSQPANNKKITFRSRLWKAIYMIECHCMANALHGYAIAHAQKAHLARWDEVMIPDVENLVDWVKLFTVCNHNALEIFPHSEYPIGHRTDDLRAEHQQRAYIPLDEPHGVLLGRRGQFRHLCFVVL